MNRRLIVTFSIKVACVLHDNYTHTRPGRNQMGFRWNFASIIIHLSFLTSCMHVVNVAAIFIYSRDGATSLCLVSELYRIWSNECLAFLKSERVRGAAAGSLGEIGVQQLEVWEKWECSSWKSGRNGGAAARSLGAWTAGRLKIPDENSRR